MKPRLSHVLILAIVAGCAGELAVRIFKALAVMAARFASL